MARREEWSRLGKRGARNEWLEALGRKRGKKFKALYEEMVALRGSNPQAFRKRIVALAKELGL